jgi:hypothetical protein
MLFEHRAPSSDGQSAAPTHWMSTLHYAIRS